MNDIPNKFTLLSLLDQRLNHKTTRTQLNNFYFSTLSRSFVKRNYNTEYR